MTVGDAQAAVKRDTKVATGQRAPYESPTLVVYGDVVRVTQSATGSKNDKGSGASTRTL